MKKKINATDDTKDMTWTPTTNKNIYQRHKKIIYDHYGTKCNCCGETNTFFLSIDHVNNDGYLDNTKKGYRKGGGWLFSKIIRENFPDSYQILCFNCNFGKAKNNGICPHYQ